MSDDQATWRRPGSENAGWAFGFLLVQPPSKEVIEAEYNVDRFMRGYAQGVRERVERDHAE